VQKKTNRECKIDDRSFYLKLAKPLISQRKTFEYQVIIDEKSLIRLFTYQDKSSKHRNAEKPTARQSITF
jgi:hypothetical protein